MTITEQTSLGDLAAAHPESVRVFQRHGLDFCCGGRKSLSIACDEAGLSATEIAREIEAEAAHAPDARDWTTASFEELIDHIITTYHDGLRRDLPLLQQLSGKVVNAHGDRSPAFARIRAIVDELSADMLSHMMKEEAVLFPIILRVGAGASAPMPLSAPISVMEAEHEDAAVLLRELRTITEDYVPPAWACPTLRALYTHLDGFERDMHVHVHLENNVLFPRALGQQPAR